jgi:ribonucleoside-diphosphate reductase alpha chain
MLSKNATYLLEKRYCRKGEAPLDVFRRTAETLAQGDVKFEERLFDLMANGVFLPNSPCLFNSGPKGGNLHACFALKVEDCLDSIFSAVSNMARIFKTGGGVGINYSSLRERGAALSGGGYSSGPLSFMENFDSVVTTVKQGGKRRGALIGILNHNHPDIFDFIKIKLVGKLQNFNLSIMVNDEFMKMVGTSKKVDLVSPKGYVTESVRAADIFEIACYTAWCNGDPGLLFFDRINKDNPYYPEIILDCVNPCSEVALFPWGACCLGSINVSKFIWKNNFNFDRFEEACRVGMRALSAMNKVSLYPMPEIEEAMAKYNPVGLGLMGFADTLIKLGIKYDSQQCLDFIDTLGEVYKRVTDDYDKDKFYFYRRIIAPTGSLSILADCSSSIEPIFDTAFERRLTVGVIEETKDIYKSEYARTAHQISPEWHVKVLAQWQKWVNGGVSKTINLTHDASVSDVKQVYKMAWELGCKGVTVYRDGCRGENGQVLVSRAKCSDEQCML